MKFKGANDTLMKTSYAVSRLSKKHNVNPVWVWDLFAENYNQLKGLNCMCTVEEANEIERIIIEDM